MSNPNDTISLPPHEVENCRGVLRVYSDGSISRSTDPILPTTTPLPTSPYTDSVIWKDFIFDPAHNLHLRLYKPSNISSSNLPIIFYIHGGGFCIGSRMWPIFHKYSLQLAAEIPAVVASADYRLAPEHRIPAAIDDCYTALVWLLLRGRGDNDVDEWLAGVADYDRVFVAGDSAGGNIAHNLAVRIGDAAAVNVRGFVLLEPFFGGSVRTKSEAEGSEDAFLNLELIDRYWRLSIPEGETRDHPTVNPFGPRSSKLEQLDLSPILVVMGSNDLLKDRSVEYVARLKEMGKKAEYVEFPNEQHGFFSLNPDGPAAKELMAVVKKFIRANANSS